MIGRNAHEATDAEIVAEYGDHLARLRQHYPGARVCRYGSVVGVAWVGARGPVNVQLLHDPGIGSMTFYGTHVPTDRYVSES